MPQSLHEEIVRFFAGILLPAKYRISYFHDRYNEGPTMMKSSIVKRSIVIDGHKTSVSLEDAFWTVLKDIAHAECVTVSKVVADIDKKRKLGNLSSALRLFVLDRTRARREGSQKSSSPAISSLAPDAI